MTNNEKDSLEETSILEQVIKEMFVTKELSVELAKKGFNEPCLAVFRNHDLYFNGCLSGYFSDIEKMGMGFNVDFENEKHVLPDFYWTCAPTLEQAVYWILKKYGINITAHISYGDGTWFWNKAQINPVINLETVDSSESFATKREALLDAIETTLKEPQSLRKRTTNH